MRGTVWPSSRALSTSCSDHSSWATFGKRHTGDLWVIYLLWCSQYPIITNQRPSLLLPRVESCVFGIKRTWEHNYDSNRPGGYPIRPRGSGRLFRKRVGLEKSERFVLPVVLGWFYCQLSEKQHIPASMQLMRGKNSSPESFPGSSRFMFMNFDEFPQGPSCK